jgi:phage gpG-like protein
MADVVFEDKRVSAFIAKAIRNTKSATTHEKRFVDQIAVHVFQDLIDHFKKEEGPQGKWKPWSKIYREHMQRIGKGGNNILQDTGRLRGGIQATNYQARRDGVSWYNRVPYAAAHEYGTKRLPKRPFMWLSKAAMKKISDVTLGFIADE